MLKEALEYLVSLKENKTYSIGTGTYSDKELHRIEPYIPRPKTVEVSGLDSIVKMIQAEADKLVAPLYILVESPMEVRAFSALDGDMKRDGLIRATADVPGFKNGFMDYQDAIIQLRSKFIQNEDVSYLLDLLSRVNVDNGVTTSDNGVTQTVEARTGVSLRTLLNIRPRVTLAPYRTFLEVEQPESEFILRLDDNARVGLFEADGGMWKLAAKQSICSYFESQFDKEIGDGKIVVMM